MPASTRIRSIVSAVAPFAAPFIALLIISAPRGLASTVTAYQIPITTRLAEAATAFGGSDAGSLLTGALWWSSITAISPGAHWIYNLWPPGGVVVDVLLVGLEALTGIPGVLLMVLLNCAVWAVFFGICFRMIARYRSRTQAVVFVAAGLLFSGVSSWGTGTGLFYADSFGAISLCFSLLLLVKAGLAPTTRRKILFAALAGIFLGGAAYFRASYDIIALATVGVGAVIVVASLAVTRVPRLSALRAGALRMAVPITVLGGVAQLFMLPWRLYLMWRIHPGDPRWTVVADGTSGGRWIPDRVMAGFLKEGHANWACISDRVQCEVIARNELATDAPYTGEGYYTRQEFDQMTLDSFLRHPLDYIAERFRALVMGMASDDGQSIKQFAIAETILLVVLLVATIVVLARRRRLFEPASAWFIGLTIAQFAVLAAFHQEPRYYLGIELSILVMSALVLGPLTYGGRRSEVVGLVPGAEAVDRTAPARLADEEGQTEDAPPKRAKKTRRTSDEVPADTP